MSNQIAEPFVTIIMPVRNESGFISRTLSAVLTQTYPHERMEVLIVDGMSTDGTRDLINQAITENAGIPVTILDNLKKFVPMGMNLALRQAMGDVVIRIDGHTLIAPDYVQRCVEHLQQEPVDGVSGAVVTLGETYLSQAIAMAMSSPFGVGNSAMRTVIKRSMLVDTIPFPAYPRHVIKRVGSYDEELIRNQDDEYNFRIRASGGKLLLADDVHSTYFSRASFGKLWKQYFQYGFWKVRVLQKHPRQMSFRQFVPPLFVLSLFASVLFAFIPALRLASLLVPAAYLLANLIASFVTTARTGIKYFPCLPIAFFILHISYGLGFLIGFVKFSNRWHDQLGKVVPLNMNTP